MSNAPNPRALPAVEKVLKLLDDHSLPRQLVTQVVRQAIQALRDRGIASPDVETFARTVRLELDHLNRTRLQPVINATGVLIHTNLGRSPLGEAAARSLADIASQYNNLEFNLTSGERGKRGAYVERLMALLVDAEAATIVNNCAAALVLILRLFTAHGPRKEVLISRGELVEIGGGFRVPEILEASGARLREVGSTNRTALEDYARAISPETAMILKVHRSNFFMEGFVADTATEALSILAREHNLPLVEDLGSGALVATDQVAKLDHEPTPNEVLQRGVDLVCFSGDKLLGGPQSGIIAGKAELISQLKREPFFRALRCDKLILSVLESTATSYLEARRRQETPELPLLKMLAYSSETLRQRAEAIGNALNDLPLKWQIRESTAQVGGGTMPKSAIPSITLDLTHEQWRPAVFAERLRLLPKPVIGYVAEDVLRLDMRTVFPRQDAELTESIRMASQNFPGIFQASDTSDKSKPEGNR